MTGGRPSRPVRSRAAGGPLFAGILLAALAAGTGAGVTPPLVAGPAADGTAVTPNGWFVTPAGRQVPLGDRPYGVAMSPDGSSLLVSNDGQSTQSLMRLDAASGRVTRTIRYASPQALYLGVAVSPDGRHAYASAGGNDTIRVYDLAGGGLAETASIPLPRSGASGHAYPAGLAVSADGRLLLAAGNLADTLAVVSLPDHAVTTVGVGHNPYGVALSSDGRTAYVSNWGEQSVSAVDLGSRRLRTTIRVGTHPSALARNPRRPELYVADTDSDTISVIDTTRDVVVRRIDVAPYPGAPEGSQPDALAVSPDGGTLYVANAGNDDVDVVRLGPAGTDVIVGMIPTGWYPTGIEVSPDGRTLDVVNAKGLGAGPNPRGPVPTRSSPAPPQQYVGSMITGTLSIVPTPDPTTLALDTRQVVANNGFDERAKVRAVRDRGASVIPRRLGDRTPITHVIYVVKENRTYDQVFGGLGKGNGDPSLQLFDDRSAPNLRELARRFVTLDNFYADAEVSADGWSWSTEGNANTYVQKNWPANYSNPGRGRDYDFEGGTYATAAGRDPTNSYLWDRLQRAGVDFRNYGVWVTGTVPAVGRGTSPALDGRTDPQYPGFNLQISDQTRIGEWLREFRQHEAAGHLPTFEFVRLPNDHTAGTRPGLPTPRAMVADNDLAVGRLVDAVSHSAFWSSTAIFVVEDDAQDGPDHVDAHRTEALVISPYTQTGTVDSTFYSTVSMLRTMELIVGLQPLTQFDAAATPMLGCFTDRPQTRPFTAIRPLQSLGELNLPAAPMSLASSRLDLTVEDRADEATLNQAIWESVRGATGAMPAPRHGLGAGREPSAQPAGDG